MRLAKKVIISVVSLSLLSAGGWYGTKYCKEVAAKKRALEQRREWLRRRKLSWDALTGVVERQIAQFNGDVGLVIKDLAMNWQITYNKEKQFPSASLVKLPIMLATFYAIEDGRIRLEDPVELKGAFKTGGSGILKSAKNGTTLTIEQLIELMITRSDNTAANMLISMLGFDYLNTMFHKMGLSETNLSRKMMDFSLRRQGVDNYTTAEEMASLLENLYRKKIINGTISEMCLSFLKRQQVNDRIPAELPTDAVVAHKTGLERNVCHDVGIIFTANGDYLICVLTKGEQGSKKAKEFISTLALYTYSYF